MKRVFLDTFLLILLSLSLVGNIAPQAQMENWIYSDASGVHITTGYYKADSNSTGELSFKFPNGTEIGNGFKYVRRANMTKANPIPNYGFENVGAIAPLNWTLSPQGSGHSLKYSTTTARTGAHSAEVLMSGLGTYSYLQSDKIYFSTKDVFYRLGFYACSNTTAPMVWQIQMETYSVTGASLRYLLIQGGSSIAQSWASYEVARFARLSNKEAYFRIRILLRDNNVKRDIYFDDLYLKKWSLEEAPNNAAVTTSFTQPTSATAIVTNSFMQNGVAIIRRYYIDQASPLVKAEIELTYPSTSDIAEEYMRFVVKSNTGWMTLAENLRFVDMNQENMTINHAPKYARNFADKWTQKIAFFKNKWSFVGADTSWGWFLEASQSTEQTVVDYIVDSLYTHFYYDRYSRDYDGTRSFKRHTGETATIKVYFAVGIAIDKTYYPILMRQPYGYLAAMSITDHTDNNRYKYMKTLMFGADNQTIVVNGSGFLGLRLPMTMSVYPLSTSLTGSDIGLNNATWLSLIRTMYQYGMEIAPHSLTNSEVTTLTNSSTNDRLNVMDEFKSQVFIDHGGVFTNLHVFGWNASRPGNYYILSQLQDHGYKYSWDYQDHQTNINMYNLLQYDDSPPFLTLLRPHSQASSIWEFPTLRQGSTLSWQPENLTQLFSASSLEEIVSQRGVLISHQYLSGTSAEDSTNFKTIGSTTYISDQLNSYLQNLYSKVYGTREIWFVPVTELLDYILKLQYVEILPDFSAPNKFEINVSNSSISGLTLNFLTPIANATIDGSYVVNIRDTRIWLPKLSVGNHNLEINFGALSSSLPRITEASVRTVYGSYDRSTLTITIDSLSKTNISTSTTAVYVGNKGEPRAVKGLNGLVSWSFNTLTQLLELTMAHNGPAQIIVDWRMSGDVNGDGEVNFSDLALLSEVFGSIPSSSNWNQSCDFNYDNFINISDLYPLGKNYNKPP